MGLRDYARRNDPARSTWKMKKKYSYKVHPRNRMVGSRVVSEKTWTTMQRRSAQKIGLRSMVGFVPYVLGGAVSYAARSDGPSVFEGGPFTSISSTETPGFVRRNWANQDSLMEEYYFG